MHEAIHDERGARQIARVFEDGDGQEQQQDVRQEDQHAADARDHAVDQQRLQQAFRAFGPEAGNRLAQPAERGVDPIHRRGADGEGEPEHDVHQAQEDRQAPDAVDDDLVDAVRSRVARFDRRPHGFLAEAGDETVAGVGDQHLGRIAQQRGQALLFGPDEAVHVAGRDAPGDFGVVFEQLEGRPAAFTRVGAGQLSFQLGLQSFDGLLQVGAVADRRRGRRGAPGGRRGGRDQLVEPRAPAADGFHDGRADQPRHFGEVELEAAGLGDVAHVEGEHHGHAQLHELHRQIQVALQVRRVDHVDDHVGFFLDDEIPRDPLFLGVGRQAVGARQIHDVEFRVAAEAGAFLLFDRHAGIVADVLAGAGQLVEQGGLAGIGIAGQGHDQGFLHRCFARFHGIRVII